MRWQTTSAKLTVLMRARPMAVRHCLSARAPRASMAIKSGGVEDEFQVIRRYRRGVVRERRQPMTSGSVRQIATGDRLRVGDGLRDGAQHKAVRGLFQQKSPPSASPSRLRTSAGRTTRPLGATFR